MDAVSTSPVAGSAASLSQTNQTSQGSQGSSQTGVARSVSPLSPGQLAEWANANRLVGRILRAAKVAAFNVWAIGGVAALSLPFALFNFADLALTAALATIAWNERRGSRLIRRLEISGPRLLGWNQLALMGAVVVYSLWRILAAVHQPSPYLAVARANPGIGPTLESVEHLQLTLTLAVYVAAIALTVALQGLNAWYYFTRAGLLRAYLRQTPAWIQDVQRGPEIALQNPASR